MLCGGSQRPASAFGRKSSKVSANRTLPCRATAATAPGLAYLLYDLLFDLLCIQGCHPQLRKKPVLPILSIQLHMADVHATMPGVAG